MKLALLALVLSAPAFAAPITSTCQLPELAGSVTVSFSDETDDFAHNLVTTQLTLNDQDIPMIRSSCFYKDVPGQRGYLCAHQANGVRFDVYPRFATDESGQNTGSVNKLSVIRWQGNDMANISTEDCR